MKFWRAILRIYLKFFTVFHDWALDRIGIRAFGGRHPKNVFHYRSGFFLERLRPEDVVIDVACGTGSTTALVAMKTRRAIGLDLNAGLLAAARARNPAPNLEYRVLDLHRVDYRALKLELGYTVAIFSHILEHLEDPVATLKDYGAPRILVCVPSEENWRTQLKKSLGLPYLSDRTHFREYTRETLASDVRKAGYEITFIGFNPEGEIVCEAARSS